MNRRIVNVEPAFKSGYSTSGNNPKYVKQLKGIEEYVPQPISSYDPETDFVPLELMPTLRTLKGYGRRMNALGALRTCRALEKVIDGIMPHITKYPELVDVILEAKSEAADIRATAFREASGEQNDNDD